MHLKSGRVLAGLMHQECLTEIRLARWAGVHKSAISHLKSGRRTTCKPEAARSIAEALRVPLDVLFTPAVSTGRGRFSARQAKDAA